MIKQYTLKCATKFKISWDGTAIGVSCVFTSGSELVNSFINEGQASYAIEVICQETFFKEVFKLNERDRVDLPFSYFHKKVVINPFVIITLPYVPKPDLFNATPTDEKLEFGIGDIIERASPVEENISEIKKEARVSDTAGEEVFSLDKLATITRSWDLYEYEYEISLEGNKIYILASEQMKNLFDELRDNEKLEPFLYLSVYKECILLALLKLAQDPYPHRIDTLWASALRLRLRDMGETLPDASEWKQINDLAQLIVFHRGTEKIYDEFFPKPEDLGPRKLKVLSFDSIAKLKKVIDNNPEEIHLPFEELTKKYSLEIEDHFLPADAVDFKLRVPEGTRQETSSDIENCLTIYRNFTKLTPALATDDRLWVTLCFNQLREYSLARWPLKEGMGKNEQAKHIRTHWFANGLRGRTRDNCIARLWWMAHIARRTRNLAHQKELKRLAFNTDYCSSLLGRHSLASSSNIIQSILNLTEEANNNNMPYDRISFRKFMKCVDSIATKTLLPSMSVDELVNFLRPHYFRYHQAPHTNASENHTSDSK